MRRKRGRPPRQTCWNIAASVDYRGVDDDQLTFVFRGVPFRTVSRVFRQLIGNGHGIAQGARVEEETDVVRRNGKGYYRVAAQMKEPNFHFASLDSQKILIEALFHREHLCNVTWMTYSRFLNV